MFIRSLRISLAIGTLAAAGWSSAAQAQALRCGNDIAKVGDNKDDVRRKCGEPAARERGCEVLEPIGGGVTACVDVETWTYRPGYGQFITKLKFQDDALAKISYGDRQ
jgi:hypothetical protein